MTFGHRLQDRTDEIVAKGPRMNGKVLRILKDKGFGFVRGDDGVERFFHRSAVATGFDRLNEGTVVTFEDESSNKGPRATDVREQE